MTSDRSRAYTRVIKTIEDMGPAKLHDLEQRRLRNAIDALVFAGPSEFSALQVLDDVELLMVRLVDSGRWSAERASELLEDIAACGPQWPDVVPIEQAA
jgi:hypothetical protein